MADSHTTWLEYLYALNPHRAASPPFPPQPAMPATATVCGEETGFSPWTRHLHRPCRMQRIAYFHNRSLHSYHNPTIVHHRITFICNDLTATSRHCHHRSTTLQTFAVDATPAQGSASPGVVTRSASLQQFEEVARQPNTRRPSSTPPE
eukprot:gene15047-biopygen11771